MVNLKFDESSKNLKTGSEIILKKLGVDFDIEISVRKSDRLFIFCDGEKGCIEYITDTSFFRMLAMFFKEYKKCSTFSYEEKIKFEKCGPMLDMSRNAALKVEKIKEYIEYCAMMGLNTFGLYLEDMYELDDHPYFGYMRGKYTKEELKEIDKYASLFGIEAIPFIQTLAHMERYLHWDEAKKIRDTFTCMLAEEESTYEFIEEAIKTMSECFTSKKIHVGMDEARDFGLGEYLRRNGYKDRTEIILGHLKRVSEIAKKYDQSISIWSDMFFKLASKDGKYSADDVNINENIKALIPDNVTLTYWSYVAEDEEEYDEMFKIHNKMSDKISFAGALQSYNGPTCDIINSEKALQPALNACVKNNIKEIYATIWMDNGAECDFFMTLAGLQLYAENMYSDGDYIKKAKENFEHITGANFDAFWDMSQFHCIFDGREYKAWVFRVYGKKAVYQDILSGMCEEHLESMPMSEHYKFYAEKMATYIDSDSKWNDYYVYAKALFDVVALKTEIAENLRKAYMSKDIEYIKSVCNYKLDDLYNKLEELKTLRIDMWYENNKPFGGEVLDIRLGGVMSRTKTAKERLEKYLNGEIDRIEELEEKRLPFASYYSRNFDRMVTNGIM